MSRPGRSFTHMTSSRRRPLELVRDWRPQVIVHHAAQMSVQVSVSDPIFDAQENILGSLSFSWRPAATTGVEKVIFASTGGAIYGDDAPLPARKEARAGPRPPMASPSWR